MEYKLCLGDDIYIYVPEEKYKNFKECIMRCKDYSVNAKQITVDCDSKYPIVICAPIENFEVVEDANI